MINLNMYPIVVRPPGTGKSPRTNNIIKEPLKEFIRYVVDIPTTNPNHESYAKSLRGGRCIFREYRVDIMVTSSK